MLLRTIKLPASSSPSFADSTPCTRASLHSVQAAHAELAEAQDGRIMNSETGSLDGFAAGRKDLWRLAYMAIYLRIGIATLRESGDSVDAKSAGAFADRLRPA